MDERITKEPRWTLGKASAISVRKSAIGADTNATHCHIVNKSICNPKASADASPVVSLILHVVVRRARVDAHLDIGVHVSEHLHSIHYGTVQCALSIHRVPIIVGGACCRFHTMIRRCIKESVIWALSHALVDNYV